MPSTLFTASLAASLAVQLGGEPEDWLPDFDPLARLFNVTGLGLDDVICALGDVVETYDDGGDAGNLLPEADLNALLALGVGGVHVLDGVTLTRVE